MAKRIIGALTRVNFPSAPRGLSLEDSLCVTSVMVSKAGCTEGNHGAGGKAAHRQGFTEKDPADQYREDDAGFPQCRDRAHRAKRACQDDRHIDDEANPAASQ